MSAYSRRVVLLGGSFAMLASGPLLAQASDALAKIRSKGTIVIGNGGAFPPFEFMENGQLTGFDRDLGEEVARRLGVRAEWIVSDFAGLIPGLTSGRTDVIISALTRTPEREQRIAFSRAYYQTGIAAAYRADVTVETPDDLVGKIVGLQTGTAGEKFTRDSYADKVKELKNYPEFPLALRDLEIGRVQVVVNTMPVLRYNLARANRAGLKLSNVWDARDIGINTRLADTGLMAELNKLLGDMSNDGFLKSLETKWLGTN
ncbi:MULTISPECIES: transporter substrate-binding domain-containing protein [unclassified Beijerinckia]|uniref:substrate-binding periplasmic protein n=1 Tax=unclassified Beijerinckia TaxID=2638183 RepID=UPI000896C2CD|nr:MULTISPECIES: transporter substrate-binding domain-containing protein [unclassified Beijerinckia]MDH7794032.1 ABC-type amino acid transport substrate-binding protein [Beijerinckia sp. GAS462]SEB51829.1 amino acid ABC transporter substrate-binding protein, PAAT family [Beijerinckia sp. 28-YEA-48]